MIRPKVATYQIVSRNRSRTRRWMPSRDEVASIAKAISGAAYRLDQLEGKFIVDLSAQSPHQYLEHIGKWVVVFIPDVRGDCRAVHHLAPVQHEELEQ